MSYISLYRKYRPKKFSEVVGQKIVINILMNSIKNNKIGHAYIFSGPRGTGKTSVAKIFSKAINCLSASGDVCDKCTNCLNQIEDEIDIIEIDAASNNGVDEIREIRNSSKLLPSNLKYKVYIIDEVHMLSTSAFNALLKTLEEPPSHVIFILATTEFDKIPATVVSRCQKFDFKKLTVNQINDRLKFILKEENRKLPDNIINLISNISNGGLRDAINLLDQTLALNNDNITENEIYDMIGEINSNEIVNLLNCILNCDIKLLITNIEKYNDQGKNYTSICNRLHELIKNIIVFGINYLPKDSINTTNIDNNKLIITSKYLFDLTSELKKTANQKEIVEIYFLKMALEYENSVEKLNNYDKNEEKNNENIKKESSKKEKNDEMISDELKKIRINNSLAGANKELKMKFLKKYASVKEYMSNKDYNSIANLMVKANPEVVSSKNILFIFKKDFELVLFNKNIDEIQKFIKLIYNVKYDIVAISDSEWTNIKNEYIKNIKNGVEYKYIDEKKQNKSTKKKTELLDSVENIFGSEYVSL